MGSNIYTSAFSIAYLEEGLHTNCNILNVMTEVDADGNDQTNFNSCSSEADVFIYFPSFADNWWGDNSTHVYFRLCYQHYYLVQPMINPMKSCHDYKMYYKEDINKLIRINKLINIL